MENQSESFLVKGTLWLQGQIQPVSVSFLCHDREAVKERINEILDKGGVPEVQRLARGSNG